MVSVVSFGSVAVYAACSKTDAPPKPAPVQEVAAPAQPAAVAVADASTDAPFALPHVDTSEWKRIELSKLGKAKLPLAGSLLVPPGSKTSSSDLQYSDGKSAGHMAFIETPDRVKVMLGVRTEVSKKDPAMLKQLIESQGTFVIDRRDPTGYMLVLESGDGFVVQGAMWPVEPGLDCATQDPLTLAQLAETLAICDSFAK